MSLRVEEQGSLKHARILGSGFVFFVGEYINYIGHTCHKTRKQISHLHILFERRSWSSYFFGLLATGQKRYGMHKLFII